MAVARTALGSRPREAGHAAARPVRRARAVRLREDRTLAHPRAGEALLLATRPLRDN